MVEAPVVMIPLLAVLDPQARSSCDHGGNGGPMIMHIDKHISLMSLKISTGNPDPRKADSLFEEMIGKLESG